MFENLNVSIYVLFGASLTYLALEVSWHFAACRLIDKSRVQPCVFKQVKNAMIPQPRYKP
jgi:hypothetical protein